MLVATGWLGQRVSHDGHFTSFVILWSMVQAIYIFPTEYFKNGQDSVARGTLSCLRKILIAAVQRLGIYLIQVLNCAIYELCDPPHPLVVNMFSGVNTEYP